MTLNYVDFMLLSSKPLFLKLKLRGVCFASLLLCGFKQIFWIIGIYSVFQGNTGTSRIMSCFLFWCCYIQPLGDDTRHWHAMTIPKSMLLFFRVIKIGENIPGTHYIIKKICFLFSFSPGKCLFEHYVICCAAFFKKLNAYLWEVKWMIFGLCGKIWGVFSCWLLRDVL